MLCYFKLFRFWKPFLTACVSFFFLVCYFWEGANDFMSRVINGFIAKWMTTNAYLKSLSRHSFVNNLLFSIWTFSPFNVNFRPWSLIQQFFIFTVFFCMFFFYFKFNDDFRCFIFPLNGFVLFHEKRIVAFQPYVYVKLLTLFVLLNFKFEWLSTLRTCFLMNGKSSYFEMKTI